MEITDLDERELHYKPDEIIKQTRERLDNRDQCRTAIIEMSDFARWAFGLDGVKSLQVLAFGVFSQRGAFKECHLLMCRDSSERDSQGRYPGLLCDDEE